MNDKELAKIIFLQYLSGMKEVLKLGEFKIGKGTEEYRYFKKVVMDQFYNPMSFVFSHMEKAGMLKRCPCNNTLRHGYNSCSGCNGSGYCNTDELNDYLADMDANRKI